jgi:hypothetical protein
MEGPRMFKKIASMLVVLLCFSTSNAVALKSSDDSKTAFARGTVTGTSWAIDYPDFAVALEEGKWTWILKAINGNSIGAGDYADFVLTDSTGKEVVNDSGYSSGANGTIEFWDYISGSDFSAIDLTQPFKGTIKVTRGYTSTLKDAVITVTVPVSGFPKRPVNLAEYVSMQTSFTSIPFPQNCSQVEFQFNVNDPYGEISNVTFAITDSKGKEVGSTMSFGSASGLQKEDIQLCPYALDGTVAPYQFTTKISFDSGTGKLALSQSALFPLASKVEEAIAKASSMGDYCAKGTASKIVAVGVPCPSGYKKVNFVVPNDIAWNSLTRMPSSQKNKNYIIYGCVAQFDANTGGSKFRGYASPVQQKYYFSDGVNSIFTGSAKSLLKLSENAAFIAKVTVTGGVSYSTFGGKTTVPSIAIKQFETIGTC